MKTTTRIVTFCALFVAACSSQASDTSTSGKILGPAKEKPASEESQASPGAIGDPCTPPDEASPHFAGFSETEVNLETNFPGCSSGICLANAFRGRTSCAYGQVASNDDMTKADPSMQRCMTTGPDSVKVEVPVRSQLPSRAPADVVTCSCRCDGPAGQGPFCACPNGFECAPLVLSYGTANSDQYAGSYCIKEGTFVPDPAVFESNPGCSPDLAGPRPTGCGDLDDAVVESDQ